MLKQSLYLCVSLAWSALAVAEALPGTRAGDVDVGEGVRIHYIQGGDRGAAATLLFVPGWSFAGSVWRDQMAAFAPAARVVAIDPRSQGDSTITVKSNTPEQRAQDMRQVIRSLALTNVVLVGWSQGVQDVAAYAAAFEGDAIRGYVLVDSLVSSGAAVAVSQPQRLQEELERLVLYQRAQRQYLHGMMNAIIHAPRARERIDEYVAIGLRTPPDLGVSMLLMDFIAPDRRPALAKFNRPTLVVAATGSGEVEALREMAGRIEGARFEVIADAGHAVFLDQPQRFQAVLADFVRSIR